MNRLPSSSIELPVNRSAAVLEPTDDADSFPMPASIPADLTRVPSGLSVNALKTLYFLHRGLRSMTRLAKNLQVTRAAMTGVIDAMEKQGIALRCAHPEDRRRTIVNLTPDGERLAKDVFPPA